MNAFMNRLLTSRLELIPATAALVRAEIDCCEPFFRLLGVEPVDDWPPVDTADALPFFLEQLEKGPEMDGLRGIWSFQGRAKGNQFLWGMADSRGRRVRTELPRSVTSCAPRTAGVGMERKRSTGL